MHCSLNDFSLISEAVRDSVLGRALLKEGFRFQPLVPSKAGFEVLKEGFLESWDHGVLQSFEGVGDGHGLKRGFLLCGWNRCGFPVLYVPLFGLSKM